MCEGDLLVERAEATDLCVECSEAGLHVVVPALEIDDVFGGYDKCVLVPPYRRYHDDK